MLMQLYGLGSIVSSGTLRATVNYPDNRAWVVPTWVQPIPCAFVMLFHWFLPETPRWMYTHGRRYKALTFLAKYHGEGFPRSSFVKLQMEEFGAELEMNGADKRWWDYRTLFKSRAARFRVLCLSMAIVFSQWTGNG